MHSLKRVKTASQLTQEIDKNLCKFFYNDKTKTYKNKAQILSDFKCQKSKSNANLLYFRKNSNEYDRVSQEQLKNCIFKYNSFYDPDRDNANNERFSIDNFLSSCTATAFNDINPNFVGLRNYIDEIIIDDDVDLKVKEFLQDLVMYTNLTYDGLQELFKGAFVIIRDDGYFYNKYGCHGRECNLTGLLSESSHDSKDPQQRLGRGSIYNCDETGTCLKYKPGETDEKGKPIGDQLNSFFDLLMGTSLIPIFYGDTWFQFEYANILTPYAKYVMHGVSTTKHIISKKNIGPLGESSYAEYEKPLILEICRDSTLVKTPTECVRPLQNLNEMTDRFLIENNINMQKYKNIKIIVKKIIGATYLDTINEFTTKLVDYLSKHYEFLTLMRNIVPSLEYLSTRNTNKYTREQILAIMFFIADYTNNPHANNDELLSQINARFSQDKKSGGKKTKKCKTKKCKTKKCKTKKCK